MRLLTSNYGRAECVKFCFGFKVSLMRFLLRCKETKVLAYRSADDGRRPHAPIFSEARTNESSSRFGYDWNVLLVLLIGAFTKVGKTVVNSITVNVVNLFFGPTSGHVKPSKAMCFVLMLIHTNRPVSFFHKCTGNIANIDSKVQADKSGKNSGFRIVVEKFAQTFCGKIGSSHDFVPHKQMIGERPRGVSAPSGLRYFTMPNKFKFVSDF